MRGRLGNCCSYLCANAAAIPHALWPAICGTGSFTNGDASSNAKRRSLRNTHTSPDNSISCAGADSVADPVSNAML